MSFVGCLGPIVFVGGLGSANTFHSISKSTKETYVKHRVIHDNDLVEDCGTDPITLSIEMHFHGPYTIAPSTAITALEAVMAAKIPLPLIVGRIPLGRGMLSLFVIESVDTKMTTFVGSGLAVADPVYQICQRCFHKTDEITLSRDTKVKRAIKRRAFRRFLHGCPPRKKNDTSFGDAINWEWIIQCANDCQAEIHIVSRDADYGITLEKKSYLNDHLWQEFKERVSKRRNIFLHTKLSEALEKFQVKVSAAEKKEETEILQTKPTLPEPDKEIQSLGQLIERAGFRRSSELTGIQLES
jgi:hypothetical protein